MSFYHEFSLDGLQTSSFQNASMMTPSFYTTPDQLTYQLGYRSRGPRGDFNQPEQDFVVDPYRWFLSEGTRRRAGDRVFIEDNGHPYYKVKQSMWTKNTPYSHNQKSNGVLRTAMSGYALNWSATGSIPELLFQLRPQFSSSNLSAFGQQAISKVAPTPYTFEASQFLGELREGLPSMVGAALIKGRAKDFLKHSGSEYLNVQFGWAPMVSDIKKLINTVVNLDSILSKRRTAQGKPKRARFATPLELISANYTLNSLPVGVFSKSSLLRLVPSSPAWGLAPNHTPVIQKVYDYARMHDDTYSGSANLRFNGSMLQTAQRRQWFEGSFTSFFDYPPPDSSWLERATSLMSLELTPQVLWELAPWSWLVDWIFHIQSSIESNSIGSDKRIVMNYGYVMEEEITRVMIDGQLAPPYPGTELLTGGSVSQLHEARFFRRLRANPFGFQATSFSGFNPNQLSILAALGLSRG